MCARVLNCIYVCACVGIKFFVTADSKAPQVDKFLQRVYELYSDYVLKNPFYEVDMPIRCELFDLHLQEEAEAYHTHQTGR